jgi:GTP-binding protein
MQITTSTHLGSYPSLAKCAVPSRPSFALIGRSNVGKSSLINMLLQRKKLAHTASRPGKTQLLNYYLINESFHLVDLPGYGWAKLSKKHRASLQQMVFNYLQQDSNLKVTLLLIDLRHPPQAIDLEMLTHLTRWGVPFAIVFTKADQCKAVVRKKNVAAFVAEATKIIAAEVPCFVTSSTHRRGREELLGYLEELLKEG